MAEIVNLRMVRKRAARAAKAKTAEANRLRFGRAGPEKRAAEIEKDRLARKLDGHRRTHDETDTP
ncbi:DUF4169 family protein [Mesorhizobium xinjiangense]|uniref:DUF4169 family protein n=1 Tax=Mesorhizobium xinjiangense TaxID=2678685 RepID=UPI0012ED4653|nr:DUF4169 family protein [Mesorhizobium xinjiangense]